MKEKRPVRLAREPKDASKAKAPAKQQAPPQPQVTQKASVEEEAEGQVENEKTSKQMQVAAGRALEREPKDAASEAKASAKPKRGWPKCSWPIGKFNASSAALHKADYLQRLVADPEADPEALHGAFTDLRALLARQDYEPKPVSRTTTNRCFTSRTPRSATGAFPCVILSQSGNPREVQRHLCASRGALTSPTSPTATTACAANRAR